MVRIQEVTHEAVPQIVFDLAISMYANTNAPYKDCSVYRSLRIADLYAHPAQAVADLSVTYKSGAPRLEFSADGASSYVIEASTNLTDWAAIGVAVESVPQSGDFSFEDSQPLHFPVRYYRVATQ